MLLFSVAVWYKVKLLCLGQVTDARSSWSRIEIFWNVELF